MPDPALLTAVADALPGEGFLIWRHGDDVGSIEREDAASAVLAAVGRVLGGRLRVEAESPEIKGKPQATAAYRFALRNAAANIDRWCGVPASSQEGQRG